MIQTGPVTLPSPSCQLDHRHVVAAVLAAVGVAADLQSQPLGRRRAHDGRVAPGQLRDRLGQFLQPAVVGEPAVVNRRVGDRHQVELRLRRQRPSRRRRPLAGAAASRRPATRSPPRQPCRRSRRRAGPSSNAARTRACRPFGPTGRASGRARSRGPALRAIRPPRPRLHVPSGRGTAARSAAARARPCRQRPGRRSSFQDNASRAGANGRAGPSRPGTVPGGFAAAPSPAPGQSSSRPPP